MKNLMSLIQQINHVEADLELCRKSQDVTKVEYLPVESIDWSCCRAYVLKSPVPDCEGCPVREDTLKDFCENTPFTTLTEAYIDQDLGLAKKALSDAEKYLGNILSALNKELNTRLEDGER